MGLRSDRLAERLARERTAAHLLGFCLAVAVLVGLLGLATRAGPPLVGEPYSPSAVVPEPAEEMTCPAETF